MKRVFAVSAILIIVLLLSIGVYWNYSSNGTETFYVGVTYCGNSVAEGKMLIDKVKTYTNLFVLQSGTLQRNLGSVDELGDYAVSAGMYFLPYFGYYIEETFSVWLESAKQKWGNRFLGVYYGDEVGGKMLDDYVEFKNKTAGESIMKTRYGDIIVEKSDGVIIHYEIGGVIHLFLPASDQNSSSSDEKGVYVTFYSNGTIKVEESNASIAASQITNLPDYATYNKLASLRPLKTVDEVANRFITRNRYNIEYLSNSTTVFSSDYALFWFDYLSGYDVMLAHIGWNLTVNQQIALARGAANLQNKDWGIVITWKYTNFPYLDSGSEIFSQLSTAYECGAKYFVLFNYYPDDGNPYGTLKDEHFEALETFWNDVVNNPQVVHGEIKGDSVLVLPKNYGWGMRWPEDKIWGIFRPDNRSRQIWDLLNSTLHEHGLSTDIVYEDPDFPLPSEYQFIYHWNPK